MKELLSLHYIISNSGRYIVGHISIIKYLLMYFAQTLRKSDMFKGIDTLGYVEHIMLRRMIDPIIW